ncbi:MarR family transcriptional regulator [Streptomyces clavuligerus]|nr:MarR family transcriptional regulator [Streptomyces clavuligerus]WDN55671.1 MarR family transcriptional regulator [Streptomyces clavuligerus]
MSGTAATTPDGRGPGAPDTAEDIAAAWERERPGTPVSSIGIVTPVWQLAKLLGDDRRRVLAHAGVDAATLDLLSVLRRSGPPYTLSTRELARRCLVTAGAVSQRVARGEREGLIRRIPGTGRPRTVLVTLTPAGHALVEATVDRVLRREAELLDGLAPAQQDDLAALLRVLLRTVQDRVGDRGLTQVGQE